MPKPENSCLHLSQISPFAHRNPPIGVRERTRLEEQPERQPDCDLLILAHSDHRQARIGQESGPAHDVRRRQRDRVG